MRVQQAFIHVNVDNLRAIFDLVACHLNRGFIIACEDQLFELGTACDIGALADIDEAGRGRGGRHFWFCFIRFRRP